MTVVFVVGAAVGSTVLVLQFLLSLIGLGGDSMGFDGSHDFGGGDHDLHGDAHGGTAHGDAAHDEQDESQHAAGNSSHLSAAWFLRALTLRTVAAALAFFGLAGMAAKSADLPPTTTLAVALGAGAAALYAVYMVMDAMRSLRAEGTVRIRRALGTEATVYLRIPGQQQGAGKIQINLQNRTMEYLAVTLGESIPTGATVVVTDVLDCDTVCVKPVAAA